MNKSLRWILIIVGIVVGAAALLWGGMLIGRSNMGLTSYGPNMMGYYPNQTGSTQAPYGFGPGMMGSGMTGYSQNYSGTLPFGPGKMGNGGMMNGNMMGNGMMGNGMMGGYNNQLYGVKPLSVDQALSAVKGYLAGLNNDDLVLDEILIFDNNAYARVIEKSTGLGAFELLVDPVTLAVSPEPGPNMMWNQKYGMMGGSGMMGMMGGAPAQQPSATMPVRAEEAIQTAQRYLDTYLPGAQAADKADPFYGYYTIETLRVRDGKTAGMLSVNGYTRQVFLHTWHGDFIETSEE